MVENGRRTIKSVEKVFDIVEILCRKDGATLSEVANGLDQSPSTIHQYLATLHKHEFVVKTDGKYVLSHRFLDYAEYARQQNDLFGLAKEKVDYLADQTGERAQLVVPEHDCVVVLYTETGEQAVKAGVRTGQRLSLHATAAGKAILAHYPEERVDDIIERHGLEPVTENTITNRDELFQVFDQIRDRGVAFNEQEDTSGLRAIGAPIKDSDGRPIGALSVSGPSYRLGQTDVEEVVVRQLRGIVNEIELNHQYK